MGITVLQKVLTFQLSFLIPNSDISFRGQIHSPLDRIITHTFSLRLPPLVLVNSTVVGDIQTPMQIPLTSARTSHRGSMGRFAGAQAPCWHPHLLPFSNSPSQSLFFVMMLNVQLLHPLHFHLESIYLHFSHVSSCPPVIVLSCLLFFSGCASAWNLITGIVICLLISTCSTQHKLRYEEKVLGRKVRTREPSCTSHTLHEDIGVLDQCEDPCGHRHKHSDLSTITSGLLTRCTEKIWEI